MTAVELEQAIRTIQASEDDKAVNDAWRLVERLVGGALTTFAKKFHDADDKRQVALLSVWEGCRNWDFRTPINLFAGGAVHDARTRCLKHERHARAKKRRADNIVSFDAEDCPVVAGREPDPCELAAAREAYDHALTFTKLTGTEFNAMTVADFMGMTTDQPVKGLTHEAKFDRWRLCYRIDGRIRSMYFKTRREGAAFVARLDADPAQAARIWEERSQFTKARRRKRETTTTP